MAKSVFQIKSESEEGAKVVEAGDMQGEDETVSDLSNATTGQIPDIAFHPVSSYTVSKPWGEEVWFTDNLVNPHYALKKIRMNAGNRSSLQSHEEKLETNYVIQGEATVLYGKIAPDDLDAVIDISSLDKSVFKVGMGWSNKRREIE